MVYLQILCHLILILVVFKPSKINYTTGLINYTYLTTSCLLPFGLRRELSRTLISRPKPLAFCLS